MEINRAPASTERRPRARRRTTRRQPPRRRRRAPACRVGRRHRLVSRGDQRQERRRRQSRRRRGARRAVRPARLTSRATPADAPVLGRVDTEFARLLAGVLGAGGPTRTLTATSLFWLLLYVGWRAGLGVEAALLLSAGAAIGALATRGSGSTENQPAPQRSGRRGGLRHAPRDRPAQSTRR